MAINRDFLKRIRPAIEKDLMDLSKTHNINIKCGSASFGDNHATFKLEISTIGENGEVMTKEAEDFKVYCHRWGLKESDLGRTFNHFGDTYKITGAKPRSSKYPILAKKLTGNGGTYKFPPSIKLD